MRIRERCSCGAEFETEFGVYDESDIEVPKGLQKEWLERHKDCGRRGVPKNIPEIPSCVRCGKELVFVAGAWHCGEGCYGVTYSEAKPEPKPKHCPRCAKPGAAWDTGHFKWYCKPCDNYF